MIPLHLNTFKVVQGLHRSNRTKFYSIRAVQRLGVGFCKFVLVKSAVPKSAVDGAKKCGRELEKNPTHQIKPRKPNLELI